MTIEVEKKQGNIAPNVNLRAFISLLVGGVAIGTAPILMRYADVTPSSSAFWRLFLAIPILSIWFAIDVRRNGRSQTPNLNFKQIRPFMLIGFFFAVDLAMWHWSVRLTTVANATLLANMSAIFTAVGAFLFFGERFSKTFIGGMFLALLGAMALMGHSFNLSPDHLFGDLLGLTTAIAYAGYMIANASARKKYSTVSIMLGTAIFASIFLYPIAINEVGDFIPSTTEGWIPLVALALFPQVIGQSLIIYALAHLPAAFGSVSLLIQPIVAAILAWILFSETLGLYHLVGAALIISGIVVSKRGVR